MFLDFTWVVGAAAVNLSIGTLASWRAASLGAASWTFARDLPASPIAPLTFRPRVLPGAAAAEAFSRRRSVRRSGTQRPRRLPRASATRRKLLVLCLLYQLIFFMHQRSLIYCSSGQQSLDRGFRFFHCSPFCCCSLRIMMYCKICTLY